MEGELPGHSIPLERGAVCLDCLVIFDSAGKACPKCGTEIGTAGLKIAGRNVPETKEDPKP